MKNIKILSSVLIIILMMSCTINVDDNNSPTVDITDGPIGTTNQNDVTFHFEGEDSDGYVSGYYVDINDSDPKIWTVNDSYTFYDLPDGTHTFYVQAQDNDGSYSIIKSRTFTVTTNTPPTVTITQGPGSQTSNSTVSFTYSGQDSDGYVTAYYVALDNSNPNIETQSTSYTFNDVSQGTHTFFVKAKDNDNEFSSTASYNFTVTQSMEISNLYYTDQVDSDGDSYYNSVKINWDVSLSSGTANVYAMIYLESYSAGVNREFYLGQTSTYTINSSSSNNYWVNLENMYMGQYDVKIELYTSSQGLVDTYGYNEAQEIKLESANESYFFWAWINEDNSIDSDNDNYYEQINLRWDADTNIGTDEVYVKLYERDTTGDEEHFYTTDPYTLNGESSDDVYYLDIGLGDGQPRGEYSYKLELYDNSDNSKLDFIEFDMIAGITDVPLEPNPKSDIRIAGSGKIKMDSKVKPDFDLRPTFTVTDKNGLKLK